MFTTEKKYNVTDFKKIGEGENCQLINGEIIMSPSPTSKHQRILRILLKQIANHLDRESKREVFCAPLDVFLDQANAFQPDILFVSKERLHIIKEDGIYGVPDLIIEILSISNSYHDLKTKKNVYEKYGVKEYWIIDPMDKEAIGFQNKQKKFIEFFRGNGGFTIKLLNLAIKID